jgi:hypothetical protein
MKYKAVSGESVMIVKRERWERGRGEREKVRENG